MKREGKKRERTKKKKRICKDNKGRVDGFKKR